MATDRSVIKVPHFSRFLAGRGPGQTRLRVAARTVVCPQGAPDDTLFYIESGWIKISVASPGGKEGVLAIRGPGNLFGTRSLIARHRRRASAVTLSACSVIRITRAAAINLVRTEPDFAEMLAIYLARQGQRDQESLADQLTYPSERRLARTLLRLAGDASERMPAEISMRVNQDDLASMIGTTRSRVSYFMNKFRRSGFIEYGRHGLVTVHKSLRSADQERRGS
jgi:CRP/FNR family transcriptional regulator, cyclic AMP receptor protein